ncbi:MAG: hypothetical protein SPF67_07455 [Eubacteriales bacterium]|nr:hypothetical protein [Eubacterium sp.]MDD7179660.1 hypothetical protein [Eubacterium sp.]MDY5494366.1 hypothetical protein [Eubacteriales bacterium]
MDPAVFEKLGAAVSDPEIQKKISAIISGDGTGMTSKPDAPCPPSSPPSPPPSPPSTIKNGRALLLALKPYMDEKRCEKIDRILSAMKLAEFAGMFKNMM